MGAVLTARRGVELRSATAVRALLAGLLALAVAGAATVIRPADASPRVAPMATVDPGIPAGPELVEVIVQGRSGVSAEVLTAAVSGAGGEILETLPIVEGAEVRIPGDRIADLASHRGVLAITLDRGVSFDELTYDQTGTASSFVGSSGAFSAWDGGHLGDGVGVAVIDTGISEMPDFTGRLVHGPDLSGEGTLVDSYGHGTVMAGIIGGSGADSVGNAGGAYTGVAPKAHLVAVKVAGANGAADVSTMLQAFHWVSAYQQQFNIRVLNLSWGTASTQDPSVDPLNYAVQRLWNQGIVVVAAAGNSGPNSGTITKPADDPLVITAGGFNDQGTIDPRDDEMVSWSSQGPTVHGLAKPDVVASGRRLIAARSYGSTVATENPKALVSPSYIRGSGSSQAAAVASGVAALLIDARPELTPDQVKALLTGTADPIFNVSANAQGAGRLDLAEALTTTAGPAYWQQATATGTGSIEASRGGRNVQTDCGNDGTIDLIQGEIDVRCEDWNGSSWTGSSWTGSSWTGSSWTGSSWTGSSWTGGTWTGDSWQGSSWTGSSWTGSSWTGSSWTGSSWTGSSWTGSSWTGSSWTTGAYEAEDDLFLTAWWGLNPPAGTYIAGERVTLPTVLTNVF